MDDGRMTKGSRVGPEPSSFVQPALSLPKGHSSLVLVHSSDLHLTSDLPYGQEEPGDQLLALRQVVDVARRSSANILLLAGDIFEHNRLPLSLLDRAARMMADAGLPIVVLPGNHDPLTPDSVYRRGGLADPPNVFVLGVSNDEAAVFAHLDLEIWGRPHLDYGDMSPLREPRPRTTRWQIATAHGHFLDPHHAHDRFLPSWLVHEEEIEATGADYVALGHWNRAARVGSGSVPAYYSGSPDLARTVNVVRLGPEGVRVIREPIGRDGPLAHADALLP
jgi:DNA repair exonuclease SbcCD nuclease subunit